MPLMKVVNYATMVMIFLTIIFQYLESKASGRNRRRRKKDITLSKTSEFGSAIDSEHLSELTEEELEQSFAEGRTHLQGFMYWDYKFLRPFFVRK